jgi:hypothetical protein
MADTPKRVKRLLRKHAGEAHEEELRRAREPVAEAFKRWERGELGSGEFPHNSRSTYPVDSAHATRCRSWGHADR